MCPKRVAVIILLPFCALPSSAQQPPEERLAGSAAVQRSCNTMGAGLAKSTTFLLTGRISFLQGTETISADVTIRYSGISKARTDIVVESKTYSVIENAGRAHTVRDGKTQRLPLHAAFHNQSPYLPALFETCDSISPHQATALARETINGEPADRIRLERDFANRPKDKADTLKSLSRIDLYLNPATSLVVRRSQIGASQINLNQTWQVDYDYSDYRLVAGILLPHRITQYVNGQRVSEIAITSVTINAGVSDADFEVR